MLTNEAHVVELLDQGYTKVEGVVPDEAIDNALHLMNRALGKGISEEEASRFANGIQYPSLMTHRAITDLYNATPVQQVVRELVGEVHPIHAGQIAMRFPGALCLGEAPTPSPMPWWQDAWHIDGLAGHLPELKPGSLGNFTALVGVVLADIPAEFGGNFTAIPGSHHVLEQHFQQHGLREVEQHGQKGLPRNLPLAEPRQLLARRGDVTVAHYMLAHSIAPNAGPNIRYMVYFRVFAAPQHKPHTYRPEPLTNLWLDWPRVAAYARQAGFRSSYPSETDREVASLRPAADSMWEAKDWPAAAPVFARLAALRPRDYVVSFKAGMCTLWAGGGPDALRRAEQHLRQAIALYPRMAPPYAVLARCLVQQGRYQEALDIVQGSFLDRQLTLPEHARSQLDDLFSILDEALARTNRSRELESFRGQLVARYAFLQSAAAASGGGRGSGGRTSSAARGPAASAASPSSPSSSSPSSSSSSTAAPPSQESPADEVVRLWAEGRTLLTAPAKNWQRGREVFARMAVLQPSESMTHLLAGICHVYDPAATEGHLVAGERYARAALQTTPSALAYALLARCMLKQAPMRRAAEIKTALDSMLAAGTGAVKEDHAWLVLDGLRVAKRVHSAEAFAAFAERFHTEFPSLRVKAEQVIAEPANCIVM